MMKSGGMGGLGWGRAHFNVPEIEGEEDYDDDDLLSVQSVQRPSFVVHRPTSEWMQDGGFWR